MVNPNKRFYIFGAPVASEYIDAYETTAERRFTNPGTTNCDWEKACDYLLRMIDRQISKAIGMLTYNGLLFTALTFAGSQLAQGQKFIPLIGATLALAACLPLLSLMVMSWSSLNEFSDPKRHFQNMSKDVFRRGYFLSLCSYASLVTSVLAVVSIYLLFNTAPVR